MFGKVIYLHTFWVFFFVAFCFVAKRVGHLGVMVNLYSNETQVNNGSILSIGETPIKRKCRCYDLLKVQETLSLFEKHVKFLTLKKLIALITQGEELNPP